MNLYVALRLRKLSVVYWFKKPDDAVFHETDDLIVNTQHGVEVGRVLRITETKPANLDEDTPFITEYVRVVNEDDRKQLRDYLLANRLLFKLVKKLTVFCHLR